MGHKKICKSYFEISVSAKREKVALGSPFNGSWIPTFTADPVSVIHDWAETLVPLGVWVVFIEKREVLT